jgi:uncharacterized protein YyaL (SSP411 family)
MQWLEWSEEAFAEARARNRPVLLYLHASWCRFCGDLEREVLSDPRVQATIAERFVAVRVDKDRRPDIDARYAKGGWPTFAYLDDQGEMIASDAYLEVDALLERLLLVSGYWLENRETIRRRLAEVSDSHATADTAAARESGELSVEIVDTVARMLLESSDPVHGGWGAQHKFPHPEALDFALIRWSQTGDEAMRKLVLRTLRNMQAGDIHDRVEGGFYRYATSPDWSAPHYEKVLDSNALRLYSYLEAAQALGEASFRETAEAIIRWMDSTLLDTEIGAFRGSQDAEPGYARLTTIAARRERGTPECDPTVFANWNAMAVSAYLKGSVVLGRSDLRAAALRTLDFIVDEMFDERGGVYHYWDGTYHLPGMLTDQAYVMRSLIDAAQFLGGTRYVEVARRIASIALETLRSPGGGFFDTRHDPSARGGLRRRNCSLLENAVMAEALLRLAHFTHENDWAEIARDTLSSFAHDYKSYGHFVAGYARAVDLWLHPPLHVIIVGPPDRADSRALQSAALAPYVASRIVQMLDPAQDQALIARYGLPNTGDGRARAFVNRGRASYAETADPQRLGVLMTRIERGA